MFKYANTMCKQFKEFNNNYSKYITDMNNKGKVKKLSQNDGAGLELIISLMNIEPKKRLSIINL